MVVKVDMTKAYRLVSWNSLDNVIGKMCSGIVEKADLYVSLMQVLLSSSSDLSRANSRASGIKQGDPLPPPLFVMITECLNRMIMVLVQELLLMV